MNDDKSKEIPIEGMNSVVHFLGKMEGMLSSVLQRMDGIENNHKHEIDRVTERMNNHGDRIKDLENHKASREGEQNGRRTTIGLVITCILLAAGFFVWFFSNGLQVLQAGAQ